MLAALEPDLIEVGDAFHPAWCAAQVAQRRGIPLVAFFHSNLPQLVRQRMGSMIGGGFTRYVRWLYARFDAVLAPSRFIRNYLHDLGVARVICQPLGVDVDTFNPSQRTLDVRRELGLADNTRLLVYAGRFSGEKNLPVLFEALARLGKPYHLLLIGGGEEKAFAPNVTAMPYRRDSGELARWIASCDALVHAGTRETFGLVIVEALACGRPVIATRAGAVPELVDDRVAHRSAGRSGRFRRRDHNRSIATSKRSAAPPASGRCGSAGRAFRAQLATYATLGVRGRDARAGDRPVPDTADQSPSANSATSPFSVVTATRRLSGDHAVATTDAPSRCASSACVVLPSRHSEAASPHHRSRVTTFALEGERGDPVGVASRLQRTRAFQPAAESQRDGALPATGREQRLFRTQPSRALSSRSRTSANGGRPAGARSTLASCMPQAITLPFGLKASVSGAPFHRSASVVNAPFATPWIHTPPNAAAPSRFAPSQASAATTPPWPS